MLLQSNIAKIIILLILIFASSCETSTTEAANETITTVETTSTVNEPSNSTFIIYYLKSNSEIISKNEIAIGSNFSLVSHADCTSFKGWILSKEQYGQIVYYSFDSNGELNWFPLEDVVAYYIFYDQDEISTSKSKEFSSGEPLYFQALYSDKIIDDSIPSHWKSFEPYTAISNKNTLNHHIAFGKDYTKSDGTILSFDTKTDSITGIRYVLIDSTRYYCVALGNYYGRIGSKHMVILDNHVAFNIIVSDEKSTKDAVCKNIDGKTYTVYHNKSNVFPESHQHEYIEFVVDMTVLKKTKSYSYGALNIEFDIYNGNVIGISD